MEFPVIINNYENKYYVEYNNKLVSISKDDVSKTKDNKNTDKKNQSKITTLAYHRIYKENRFSGTLFELCFQCIYFLLH